MREVALRAREKSVEGFEPSEAWGQVPVAEAEVPLAHSVGVVAQLSQGLGQQLHTGVQPAQVLAFDLADLHADLVWISANKVSELPSQPAW